MGDSTGSNRGQKPTVRATRRRRTTDSQGAPRERATAPRREGRQTQRTTSQPTPAGSTQSSAPLSGLGQLLQGAASSGGTRRPLMGLSPIVIILIIVFICAALILCRCGGGLGDLADLGLGMVDQGSGSLLPEATVPSSQPTVAPTIASQPFVVPAGSASGDTWLVMLYQDADDKILEKDIYLDLNEAERVGSTENVRIVSQIDRYSGGYTGDGNWSSTRRYYLTQDQDLTRVGSQLVADLGELNMADPNTLIDFVTWAVETFPSDKYALIMSDHGMGWPGGWTDPDPAVRTQPSTALASALGNQLYLDELDAALAEIRQRTGIGQFELIGMDACLMAQLEVFAALAPHARYAVGSEETEPALGWAYTSFLGDLAANPGMDGAQLGHLIVDSYIREDQRIVDDQERAELLRQGSPMGGLLGFSVPTVDQVASQMERGVTLSVVDLAEVPALVTSVNDLCLTLQGADQAKVAQARSYAQSFTSIFGQQVPASFIDLGNFVGLLQQARLGGTADQALANVSGALQRAVIAETHGSGKPGATGVAVYFPNSQLYRTDAAGPASYVPMADALARSSLWDDFLAHHYTGRSFTAGSVEAVIPAESEAVTAPGQGDSSISQVRASSSVARPGAPVLLSADIDASNLGHVLLFAGYYDSAANSLFVIDMDYLESPNTRQVDGVYYPVWPDVEFTLEFEWEPIVYYIDDGQDSVSALLTPQDYGVTFEQAIYTVDGIYTFASGETRTARLYFANGRLQRVFGFTGDGTAGAPREIHPETGDRFTVVEEWLDLDDQGRVIAQAVQQGGTLTFGDQMFTWVELDAAPGNYVVGFIAQDLDGNAKQAFTQITVQ